MTPEAQRIAIAEACGWTFHPDAPIDMKLVAVMCWIRPGNATWETERLPDYLNDLNAMREAQAALVKTEYYYSYYQELWEMTGLCMDYGLHATASQRAEALLRTIGKWEDDK